MEPQLIDYYNDEPYTINIIDKLNEEYEDAMTKIKQLEEENKVLQQQQKILQKYKKPDMPSYEDLDTFEETTKQFIIFMYGGDEDEIDLGTDLLEDYKHINEKVYNSSAYGSYKKESLIHKLIDKLDILTNHQNYEWCKIKVLSTCETYGINNEYPYWEAPRVEVSQFISTLVNMNLTPKTLSSFN